MLPEFLRQLRTHAGLTQRQVSAATGIPLSTLYDYERGTHAPAPDRLGVLLEVYDATAGQRLDAFNYFIEPKHSGAAAI